MSQDVTVGDMLVGDDGLSRTVTDLCSGGDEMYEVSQKNGVSYTVNSKHKLALKFSGDRKIYWSAGENAWKMSWFDHETHVIKHAAEPVTETRSTDAARASLEDLKSSIQFPSVVEITVDDFMKLSKSSKTSLMGFKAAGVQWPRRELRLDPYMMGLWLGDGINDGMSFAASSESDPEIIQYLLNWCDEHGAELVHDDTYRFRVRRRGNGDRLAIGRGATSSSCSGCSMKKFACCDTPSRPYTDEAGTLQKNPLKEVLDSYGLTRQKFIPVDFLVNDRESRLQLLAGLVDTDGFVGNDGKRIQIAQANHLLARQIEMLARSLGFAVTICLIKKKQIAFGNGEPKDYADHLGLNISGDHLSDIPCRIARKKCTSSAQNKDQMRTGIKVTSVGRGTYYGWSVTDNKRFLLPDLTVVRNCDQMWCTQDGCNTAFSWNTGHVVTGIVHNPHYYEWLRRTGAQARETGDIPCGGVPGFRLLTLLSRATYMPEKMRNTLYDMHRAIMDFQNVRLPQYPARMPALANKDEDIAYLMNELTEEQWQRALEIKEARFIRKREIGQILQTLITAASDILNAIQARFDEANLQQEAKQRVRNAAALKSSQDPAVRRVALATVQVEMNKYILEEGAKMNAWIEENVLKQLRQLFDYTNEAFKTLGASQHMAVPQISDKWEWKAARILYRPAKAGATAVETRTETEDDT
jgi:hypothetical protein